ncbi:MAG: class I SAM-dependent methyltransferase [Candidatus Obscuribacter sp.]|nr:class I SAM-dependent methyltransferase [Candidatus Obscuribacter sp.]
MQWRSNSQLSRQALCGNHAKGRQDRDLCCGIGGDTIALAQYFDVTGFDLDETRPQLAHANAHVGCKTNPSAAVGCDKL